MGVLGFFVSGVINAPSPVVSLKEDLTRYIDNARLWAANESQINNAIVKAREDQFVHDDLIIKIIRPVVRVSQKYVQQLENYQPQTLPLRNIHSEYVEAWRAHYLAIASIIDSVEKKDYPQIERANNNLLEAQRSVSDALADLARLMRESGLRSEAPGDQLSTPSALPHAAPSTQSKPTTPAPDTTNYPPADMAGFRAVATIPSAEPRAASRCQAEVCAEVRLRGHGPTPRHTDPRKCAWVHGPSHPQPFGEDRN
jgi:hypothetical protein